MALRFVGGATGVEDNLLSKVMTLDASSVPLNAPPPPAEMLGCCARSRLADVTQGVTEAAGEPFRTKFRGTAVPFWLMATIAKLPELGSL